MKALTLTIILFSLIACNGLESSNNLAKGGATSTIVVQSDAYTNDGSIAMSSSMRTLNNLFFFPMAMAAPITDFQFCITKLKVVSEGEQAAGASQEAILGLVDVSNPAAVTNWGNIELAEGSSVSEIHFEVHQDAENCSGENFSVSYNGQTLTQDLEFKFKFDPAITIQNGDTLTLGLGTIAKAMEDAHTAGQFNNAQITTYMENAQVGTGSQD